MIGTSGSRLHPYINNSIKLNTTYILKKLYQLLPIDASIINSKQTEHTVPGHIIIITYNFHNIWT